MAKVPRIFTLVLAQNDGFDCIIALYNQLEKLVEQGGVLPPVPKPISPGLDMPKIVGCSTLDR
jgi:hypothetical protein